MGSARLTAAARRQQVMQVATSLFARQGYSGTTTREIAEHAGVNEAIIFRHFASKEELYWAILGAQTEASGARARLRQILAAQSSDEEIFAAIAADILRRHSADDTLFRLLLFCGLETHELSHRFYVTYISSYYEAVAERIRARIKKGKFRAIDPLLAARGFLGMVFYHHLIESLFGGRTSQKFSIAAVSRTLSEIWLQGMLPDSKRKTRLADRSILGKPLRQNSNHGNGHCNLNLDQGKAIRSSITKLKASRLTHSSRPLN